MLPIAVFPPSSAKSSLQSVDCAPLKGGRTSCDFRKRVKATLGGFENSFPVRIGEAALGCGYAGGLTKVREMASLVWTKASGCRSQLSQRGKGWGAMKGQPS